MGEIYIGNYVVVPHPADWSSSPALRFEQLTQVTEDNKGAESRGSIWHAKRRRLIYQLRGDDGRECGIIEETLRVAQEAKAAAVPYWPAMRWVDAIDSTTITFSAVIAVPLAAQHTLWWYHPDTASWGVITVVWSSGKMCGVESIPTGLEAGAMIAPVVFGVIESIEPGELNGAARIYRINFAENVGEASGTRRSCSDNPTMGLSCSGEYIEIIVERDPVSDSPTMGLSCSGEYIEIIVAIDPIAENPSVSLTCDGEYVQIVTEAGSFSDNPSMSLSCTGSYF
jgi:hypothetical protein